jgi:amino acid adenylation domain-containing protein/non-ribosomal peptide synthase protein (TIGR01720 family)
VSAGLKQLSRREGVTLFMTLLAAFQTLLHRYTRQHDIVVGTPVAGRNDKAIEPLIGFFVNTLPLRIKLRGEMRFTELLQRVKEVCLGAYTHQDVPFEKLVEELQPERHLSRSPLFQTTCMLQNAPRQELRLSGLALSPVDGENTTAKFDLSLALKEKDEQLYGSLDYSKDLFDKARIERMLRHFEILLHGIVTNPEQSLWELPLLSDEEWQQTVREWNDTRCDYGPATVIHELFEAQAQRNAHAIALVYGEQELSYGELNRRANQLAHYLRRHGVGAEVVVGLCLERSLELVVALLGVLKAGGAYVPLDPKYPRQRVAYMLADVQVQLVLTQASLREQLEDVPAILLDQEWEAIAVESEENPLPVSETRNLAYVIYTSGSTGQPKGVMVAHRGLWNLTKQAKSFGIASTSRVLQFASLNFDASIFEICMALCNGARLHVASNEQLLVGPALNQLLHEQEISAVLLPPTVLKHMKDGEEFSKLETLIGGGEACGEELVEQWSKGRRFLNAYGPTEATVCATLEQCRRGEGRPPIGRALANTEVYVLDESMAVVPVGVSGEIYIGGVGLARGYWQRAELTAELFVPHPYSTSGGERLYRTGDEGRYLEDGRIEYLGRRDQQVKVRGYRIELGEIEAVLESHARVQQAVVTVREESAGDQRLVGYVVGENWPSEREAAAELRTYLKERLPEYMVPQRWVLLEQMPLTVNGKIDHQALPEPGRSDTSQAPVGELTPIEKTLAGIWSSVLQVDHIGRNDNFFELGGDSILSIQIASQAHQLGLQITPRDIFRHQTIAELAAVAGSVNQSSAEQETVEGSLPLMPIQRWFFERELTNVQHFNQSVILDVPACPDLAALKQSIAKLIEHHDALRMRFPDTEARINAQIVGRETNEVFSEVDLSHTPESLRVKELEATAGKVQASLNLADGPLARFVYFNFGRHIPGRLLIVIHHLVVDGVSWRILVEDLRKAYQQALARETLTLPPKTTSFKRWAESLQQYAESEELAAELNHWIAISKARVPSLPVDFPHSADHQSDRHSVNSPLTVEETRGLLQDVPKVHHTQINDVLIAALAHTVLTWSGASNILIDLEGHGREPFDPSIDLSRTVGWFTTLHPVLLKIRSSYSWEELLQYAGDQLRLAPNNGLGYGVLKFLAGESISALLRNGGSSEICFNYLGQFHQPSSEETLFRFASESTGETSSEWGKRRYLFDVTCIVAGERLMTKWTYNRNIHRLDTIEQLAEQYLDALRQIIENSQSASAALMPR